MYEYSTLLQSVLTTASSFFSRPLIFSKNIKFQYKAIDSNPFNTQYAMPMVDRLVEVSFIRFLLELVIKNDFKIGIKNKKLDSSRLGYVCFQRLPLWLHPNVLTVLTLILTLIGYGLLAYYDWTFYVVIFGSNFSSKNTALWKAVVVNE